MGNVKVSLKNTKVFEKNIMEYGEKVTKIHEELHKKAKDKKEFLGWLNLPTNYDKKEFEKIKKSAQKSTNSFLQKYDEVGIRPCVQKIISPSSSYPESMFAI